jgi:hypothetical protein
MWKPPLDPDVADLAPCDPATHRIRRRALGHYLRMLDAMPTAPTGGRSRGSCCMLMPSGSMIVPGARSIVISRAPNGCRVSDIATCFGTVSGMTTAISNDRAGGHGLQTKSITRATTSAVCRTGALCQGRNPYVNPEAPWPEHLIIT